LHHPTKTLSNVVFAKLFVCQERERERERERQAREGSHILEYHLTVVFESEFQLCACQEKWLMNVRMAEEILTILRQE
jgi:hypothetical protein